MNGSPDSAARDAPGWYGKLAALGDFASRRLPPEFIRVGDDWLARSMNASREQLGARWLDAYLTAPVSRFAWAPGVAGDSWWFGLMMPSCDNVGRYFPLLVAQRRSRPPLDRIALDHLEAWFDHVAEAATRTLGERASVDAFEQALADAPPWPTPGAPAALTQQHGPRGLRYQLDARASLSHWLYAMAIAELHTRFAGCSIWWRPGTATRDAVANVMPGLPDPATFAEMLSG